MGERPIIFSGTMIRAILAGTKGQTRRIVRELPGNRGALVGEHVLFWRRGEEDPRRWCGCDGLGSLGWVHCPYGEPGDHLWVRETWGDADRYYQGHDNDTPGVIAYRADLSAIQYDAPKPRPIPKYDLDQWNWDKMTWRPSIFMPRWASRLTLAVTDVRVERLQDISEEDIAAEGCTVDAVAEMTGVPWSSMPELHDAWREGWNYINGKRAPWASNPWVFVVTFARVEPATVNA